MQQPEEDKRFPDFGVYNSFEVDLKRKYTYGRGIVLKPVLRLLALLRIQPDWVSFLGWVVSLAMFLLAPDISPLALVGLLAAYVAMDNLDGALAEFQGHCDTGQIVDNYFDFLSLVMILLTLARLDWLPHAWIFLFGALYFFILVGGFIAKFNGLDVLILRVRILVFLAVALVGCFGVPQTVFWYAMWLGLVGQVCSAFSIGKAILSAPRRLRYPRFLDRQPRFTIGLGLLALLTTIGLNIDYFLRL